MRSRGRLHMSSSSVTNVDFIVEAMESEEGESSV